MSDYLTNVSNALLGRKKGSEAFTNSHDIQAYTQGYTAIAFTMLLVSIVISVLYAYGAAKLSYCYNVSIGNGGSAFMWSVLAFFFSAAYYPYYSLFLNPLCAAKVGGRRN